MTVRTVGLDDPAYGELMAEYVAERLALDRSRNARLITDVLAAADHRFVYVSFLVERLIAGGVAAEAVSTLPRGDDLYRSWLAGLEREHGEKAAGAIRDVLGALAADELAHAWVFGAGRITDRATGGVLTPLQEAYSGLSLDLLAAVLDLDRPGGTGVDRMDPGLVETLHRIQGALRIDRVDGGATRYRLGLKELLPILLGDPRWVQRLASRQARFASLGLDAAEDIAGAEADAMAWTRFGALAPKLEAYVEGCGSDTVRQRHQTSDVGRICWAFGLSASNRGQDSDAVRWHTLAIAAAERRRSPQDVDASNDLANAYMNRGVAKKNGGDPTGAVQDYDLAIVLMTAIRDAQGEAWTIPLQNDLANAYMNRGVAKDDLGDLAGAVQDYDRAIALMTAIRDALGEAWTIPLQNDLARAYMNRGNAKDDLGDLTGAVQDYDLAIALRTTIRDVLGEAWTIPLQNDLASAYTNRGNAHDNGGDLTGAVQDYDFAIVLMTAIRDAQGEAWTIPLQNDLAGAYMNHGIAKKNGGDLAGAVQDYDLAIVLMTVIRDALGEAWTIPLQNDLASAYMNRGIAKANGSDLTEAVQDFDRAIALMTAIRDAQGEAWTIPLQNDLARAYMNHGVAKMNGGDLTGAVQDYDLAIALRTAIRDTLGEAWPIPLQNDLALALENRSLARGLLGDTDGAADDEGQAAALRARNRSGAS